MADLEFPLHYFIQESNHAGTQAEDQGREARGGEADDGRVQERHAAGREQDRPQGQERQAGGGDRAQGERPVEEAQVRRRLRVFLHDPDDKYHDLTLRPDPNAWPDFISQMIVCHGLLLEHAWIPEHMIKLIVELLDEQPVGAKYSGNVVELKRT